MTTFLHDLVDAVYYQKLAEGILIDEDDLDLPNLFNREEEKLTKMLRHIYTRDHRRSNLDKIKAIAFEGTAPEEYVSTLMDRQRTRIIKYILHTYFPSIRITTIILLMLLSKTL